MITLTPKRNFESSHKLESPINSLQGRETWSVRGDISDIAGKFKQCQQKQIKENRKSPFSLKMLLNLSAKILCCSQWGLLPYMNMFVFEEKNLREI